jgi:hypothetical protein
MGRKIAQIGLEFFINGWLNIWLIAHKNKINKYRTDHNVLTNGVFVTSFPNYQNKFIFWKQLFYHSKYFTMHIFFLFWKVIYTHFKQNWRDSEHTSHYAEAKQTKKMVKKMWLCKHSCMMFCQRKEQLQGWTTQTCRNVGLRIHMIMNMNIFFC